MSNAARIARFVAVGLLIVGSLCICLALLMVFDDLSAMGPEDNVPNAEYVVPALAGVVFVVAGGTLLGRQSKSQVF